MLPENVDEAAVPIWKSLRFESEPLISGTEKKPLPLSVSLKVKVLFTSNEDIKTFSGSMFFLNEII